MEYFNHKDEILEKTYFYVVLNVIKKLQNYKINKVFTTPRTEREIVVFVISIAAFLLQNKNKSQ